jgi:hypothetical protein
MATEYDIGDVVRIKASFTSTIPNSLPTSVTFYIRRPDGSTAVKNSGIDPDLISEGNGIYHVDIEITQAGTWRYRFAATAPVKSAVEGEFRAKRSWFV